MQISRRHFHKLAFSASAAAAMGILGRGVAFGQSSGGGYRAMVGVFLFGGNDGWNMVVPTDTRYAGYASSRGTVALAQNKLIALQGSPYALHPAMSALNSVWADGALGLVLNAGTLYAPLTKALYQSRADLRPTNLQSHSDEQAHWQGLRARSDNYDGFMGRIADRASERPAHAPFAADDADTRHCHSPTRMLHARHGPDPQYRRPHGCRGQRRERNRHLS